MKGVGPPGIGEYVIVAEAHAEHVRHLCRDRYMRRKYVVTVL